MQTSTVREALNLAKQLAGEAADRTRSVVGGAAFERKHDNSLVTEMDQALQRRMVEAIAERFPDHAIVAEESGGPVPGRPTPDQARYCWVIDPLDGTRNFVTGFPFFATSIGVLDAGVPVAAVVCEHNQKNMYSACAGAGAMLDDRPMNAAEPVAGADWLLGVPSSKDALTRQVVATWMSRRGYILRNVGSTSLHMAMVASGALNGAFCKQCKIWDIAAGMLLVSESGGRVTDAVGRPRAALTLAPPWDADAPILAAPPELHAVLLSSIDATQGATA